MKVKGIPGLGERLEQNVEAGILVVSPGEGKNAWVLVLVHSYELPVPVAGQVHLVWGVSPTTTPTPDVCEQGLGCLAEMSVVYARWEVSEPWAFTASSSSCPEL